VVSVPAPWSEGGVSLGAALPLSTFAPAVVHTMSPRWAFLGIAQGRVFWGNWYGSFPAVGSFWASQVCASTHHLML